MYWQPIKNKYFIIDFIYLNVVKMAKTLMNFWRKWWEHWWWKEWWWTNLKSIKTALPDWPLLSEEIHDVVSEALQIVHGSRKVEDAKEWIVKLDEIKRWLDEEIWKKRWILMHWLEEEKQRREENIAELQEEEQLHQNREDRFNRIMKLKYAVALFIASLIGGAWYNIWTHIIDSEEEVQARMAKHKAVKEKVRETILKLWGKVDQSITMNQTTFFSNNTVAFNQREFSKYEDGYVYEFTGNYREYETVLKVPFLQPSNIVVVMNDTETELYNITPEVLSEFLDNKYTELRKKDNLEAAQKAQKEAEKIEKDRLKKIEKIEKEAQQAAEQERKQQEETQKELQIEQEKNDIISGRKKGVVETIKSISGQETYTLGEDFSLVVEREGVQLELYFTSERLLGDLREDESWLDSIRVVNNSTMKFFLDPEKSGIMGDSSSDLRVFGNPNSSSHIEVSVVEPHDFNVHFVYADNDKQYEVSGFNISKIEEFQRDITLELFWSLEDNQREVEKISQKKEAVREVLLRLSGNENIKLWQDFDFEVSDGEHDIVFSLSPKKGNGGLKNEDAFIQQGSKYTLVWTSMRSETLTIYPLKTFWISIDLEEPYNMGYHIENSQYSSQQESWYSSENFLQMLSDIHQYAIRGSQK